MTKTNISEDKLKFINLHKSYFSELENTSCDISDTKVIIYESSSINPDPASVQIEISASSYVIYYWDGYSLAEKIDTDSYSKALIQFKKLAKKLAKNLKRFS